MDQKISFIALRQHFTPRRIQHEGRDHVIAPVVMLVEGVHAGSRGPSLYTAAVIARNPAVWNGVPVTIQHPTDQQGPISANSPHVIERQAIGKMYNVQWTAGKLKGEAWVDVAKAEAVQGGAEILQAVNSGQIQLEVSTGLFDESKEQAGTWNNEQYSQVIERIYPDHLALLPGGTGACSWADGCGMRANCRFTGETQMNKSCQCLDQKPIKIDEQLGKNLIQSIRANEADGVISEIEQLADRTAGEITDARANPEALKALSARFAQQMGFAVNEIGYNAITEKLNAIVDGWDRRDGPGSRIINYLQEVFNNHFIYRRRKEGEEEKLYSLPYSMQGDTVTIDENAEPQEVMMKREYVPVSNAKTKRVADEDLPASAFAYVGDPQDLATWKLPIKFSTEEKTKSHIRNALARFSQTQGIPANERAAVLAKIKAAAKRYGIGQTNNVERAKAARKIFENKSCPCTQNP